MKEVKPRRNKPIAQLIKNYRDKNAPVGRNSVSSIGQNQSLTSLLY